MARMSSPNGDEVLTVSTDVGANVLRSLGWSQEGGSSARSAQTTSSDSGSAEQSEQSQRRKPGRPRKNPRPEEQRAESEGTTSESTEG